MENEPRRRGGKRPGAGRPPRAEEPSSIQVAIRLTPKEVDDLDRLVASAGTNRAEVVRGLIRDAAG